MAEEFTDKQLKFLDALFNEAEGDFKKARAIAGYSKNNKEWLTDALAKKITELASHYLATHSVRATMAMIDVMDRPDEMGNDKKLAAAKELLDRAGLTKVERLQVDVNKPIGIFVLPPKDTENVSSGDSKNE